MYNLLILFEHQSASLLRDSLADLGEDFFDDICRKRAAPKPVEEERPGVCNAESSR